MSRLFPVLLEPHKIPKKLQSDTGEFASLATFGVHQYLKKVTRKSLKVLPKICLVKLYQLSLEGFSFLYLVDS